MTTYLMSFAAGVMVGVIYSLIKVRSPAPPVIALIGLLGILAGEQFPPLVRNLLLRESLATSWFNQVQPHVFGHLGKGQNSSDKSAAEAAGEDPRSGG